MINEDQVGYVKGRRGTDVARLIQDAIDFANTQQTEWCIFFVDFQKAFDTLEWNFIQKCLSAYGFKEGFIKWVSVLYKDVFNSIILNGWLTENIYPSRGIRQGCPLSALLFILAIEMIAIQVRDTKRVEGISIGHPSKELKTALLADDMTLFLRNTRSAQTALQMIENFGEKSGIKLNREKTKALWLGQSDPLDTVFDIPWADSLVKSLGIYFSKHTKISNELNWSDEKVLKIKRILDLWKGRHLTYRGRIVILKTFILSRLVYTSQVITCPNSVIKIIDKLLFDFLWGSPAVRVKKSYVMKDISAGGLNMIDLATQFNSIKIKWICKFIDNSQGKWKWFFEYWFEKLGGVQVILNCRCDPKYILTKCRLLPVFYSDMLSTYFSFKENIHLKGRCVLSKDIDTCKEMLWLNTHIRLRGEMFLFKNWIKSNIIFVGDIVVKDGIISMLRVKQKMAICDGRFFSEYARCRVALRRVWSEQLAKVNVKSFNEFRA